MKCVEVLDFSRFNPTIIQFRIFLTRCVFLTSIYLIKQNIAGVDRPAIVRVALGIFIERCESGMAYVTEDGNGRALPPSKGVRVVGTQFLHISTCGEQGL